MRYTDPRTVVSPRSVITNLNVIYDGGEEGISIATMKWDGDDAIGIRWNIAMNEWDDPKKVAEEKVCLGLPISRALPVWYILPSLKKCPEDVKQIVREKLKL